MVFICFSLLYFFGEDVFEYSQTFIYIYYWRVIEWRQEEIKHSRKAGNAQLRGIFSINIEKRSTSFYMKLRWLRFLLRNWTFWYETFKNRYFTFSLFSQKKLTKTTSECNQKIEFLALESSVKCVLFWAYFLQYWIKIWQ